MPAVPAAFAPLVRSRAFGQFVRFGIAGAGVTAFSVATYGVSAAVLRVPPMLANAVAYLAGLAAGYLVHSRWSFAADGREDRLMVVRFVGATLFGFALNSLWVWIATVLFRLPPLAPVPAMVCLTPLVSFFLQRHWVFRAA